MVLVSVSVSHRTAAFELLDRLSAVTGRAAQRDFLVDDAAGGVLVSTCNRVELYLDAPPERADAVADAAVVALADAVGMDRARLAGATSRASGADALRHLFAVTAGLESVAVGEDEIAGQIRRAYDAARSAGATTPELDQAFQRAISVSREVRGAIGLGEHGRSLVQFALDLAGHRVTDWRQCRVLVVGTGNYAATTIANLRSLGVGELAVYSATGRADAFAERYGVTARRDLGEAIAAAEVVITCTRAYTVGRGDFPADERRRLVIDLGMPRNVDADVVGLPGVELLDLELIARHARLPEFAPELEARRLVDSATERFTAELTAAPAIVALRRHVFDALDREIERLQTRAGGPEQAQTAVEALRHLAGMLLHEPSARAREAAMQGRADEFEAALRTVFGIEAPGPEGGAVTPMPVPAADGRARRDRRA